MDEEEWYVQSKEEGISQTPPTVDENLGKPYYPSLGGGVKHIGKFSGIFSDIFWGFTGKFRGFKSGLTKLRLNSVKLGLV